MFYNNLKGLTKREKAMFDSVCTYLNLCMRRMGVRHLYGEEDQILMDLWIDCFPYNRNADGSIATRIVREKVWRVVDGKLTEVVTEKEVREHCFEKSVVDSVSMGIFKWRGEQLLLNRIRYLFGDNRIPKRCKDGKQLTEVVVDAWGNERVKAVWEGYDKDKKSRRNLHLKTNESDLVSQDGEQLTLEHVAGGVEDEYDSILLDMSLRSVCDEVEMEVLNRIMEGETQVSIGKDLVERGIAWSYSHMRKLKSKVAQLLCQTESAY